MNENKKEEDPPQSDSTPEETSDQLHSVEAGNVDDQPEVVTMSEQEKTEKSDEENPSQTEPSSTGMSNLPSNETDEGRVDNTAETQEKESQDTHEEGYQETYTIDDAVDNAGYGKFQKILTFLAGLGWLADSFEVIILSIIGDLLACDWDIKRWQNALMTSMVFCGMAFGAPTFGIFADRFGRRTAIALSMALLFIFGGASAGSQNDTQMIILRAIMGFSLGGVAQSVTLCCEYYPANVRGRAGFYLSYYWSIGAMGVVAAAWIIMKHYEDWRVLVFVAAVPSLIVLISMWWYPESARYYLVSNQPQKAKETLKKMCEWNGGELPKGKLVEMDATEERGRIMDLLKPTMRRTTLLFWYMWIAVAMAYYGIALVTPEIIKSKSLMDAAARNENKSIAEDFNSYMPCVHYSNENFKNLLWTTAAEFPGILIFSLTVEYASRKAYLGTSCILLAVLMLLLMLKIEPQIAILIVLFVCRALVAAIFQLLFIMTTEAFPTTLRASAMGTGSGCARLGGIIVPFLAQVTVITKPVPSIFVLSGITALAGIAAFLLPLETRGLAMLDIVRQEKKLID